MKAVEAHLETALKSIDELPYVVGLVRQSFERQMGEGSPE